MNIFNMNRLIIQTQYDELYRLQMIDYFYFIHKVSLEHAYCSNSFYGYK